MTNDLPAPNPVTAYARPAATWYVGTGADYRPAVAPHYTLQVGQPAPVSDVFAAALAAAAHAKASQAAPAPSAPLVSRPGGAEITPAKLAALRARIARTRSQATRDRLTTRAARWAQILGEQA